MQVEPFSQYSIIFYCITITAALYAIFAYVVQKKVGNPTRVKEIQTEMQDINKRYYAAVKSSDNSKIKKAELDQQRIPTLMMESMKYQFMPLLVLLPVLFVLPSFLKSQFPVFEIETPVSIPLFPLNFLRFDFSGFPNLRSIFGTYGWFWVAVVFIGLFAQLGLWAVGKIKKALGISEEKK